jgi:hypothetical protein
LVGPSCSLRVSSRGGKRADDSGCPREAEEGNVVGLRHKAQATARVATILVGDASFARSFDPFTSTSRNIARASSDGEASTEASRSGKPAQVGGTDTGVFGDGRCAARRAPPLPQGSCVTRQKRKEVMASVPARIDELGSVARTSYAVAEIVRRRVVSNKLGKRAPKRAAGSSEQGPSSERGSAGRTVGKRVERNLRRGSDSPGSNGEDRRKAQNDGRPSFSGDSIVESGVVVAGPGS